MPELTDDKPIPHRPSWSVCTKHSLESLQVHRWLMPGVFHFVENLFGLGKTNGVVAKVIDAVPLAQERISQDGQRTNRLREVHAHETADAGALELKDVVVGADGEIVAAKGESEIRQGVNSSTINAVLSSEALGGANLLVKQLSQGGGQSDERSAGVEDDTSVLQLGLVVAKSDGVKLDLPVGLAAQRNGDQLTSVVALVHTTEGGLGLVTIIVSVAQIKGKDRLI